MEHYSKKSTWKWIALYIVLGAVVYGAVYYFYFYFYKKGEYSYAPQNYQAETQIKNETADWKVYENAAMGFSFRYPLDFQLQDSQIAPNVLGLGGILGVRKFDNLDKELSGLNKVLADTANTGDVSRKEVIIDGFNAQDIFYRELYLKPMSGGPFWEISVYIPDKNINIFVQTNDQQSIDVFRKIISTFKFIDSHNKTADWNTLVSGKVFADTYTSGHVGIFKPDHTLPSAWGLDYGGPHDTRLRSGVGTWKVENNTLIINMPDDPVAIKYNLQAMQQEKINNSIIRGMWTVFGKENRGGFFVGDNFSVLSQFTGSDIHFEYLTQYLPK